MSERTVDLASLLSKAPQRTQILKTMLVMRQKLQTHLRIVCSISGGSDSDIVMDLIEKLKDNCSIRYIYFDTGLEYAATHKHIDYLKQKYGVDIEKLPAATPIPLGCKKYGQPFLTKKVSNYVSRLQRHNFTWEDKPFSNLFAQYPCCKAALQWWCNDYGSKSRFNISAIPYLKEFLIENPPSLPISDKCCEGAKKKPLSQCIALYHPDLRINGMRQDEGGMRSLVYHNCYSPATDSRGAEYRPLFFWNDEDKRIYKKHYQIQYSDAYEVYGLTRTGCAGCPFASGFENELQVIHQYEPNLEKAVYSIFKDSYAYTRNYRDFKKEQKKRRGMMNHAQTKSCDSIAPDSKGAAAFK